MLRRLLPVFAWIPAVCGVACVADESPAPSVPQEASRLEASRPDPLAENSSVTGAWEPSYTGYPRTLFRAADKDRIAARLARTDQPFATLASRIRSSCNSTPAVYDDADGLDQAAIYTNGNIARNCAFLAYIENNSTAANKARDILITWPSDLGRLSQETFDNTDIHVGEALSSAVQAYDLLKGTTLVSSGDFAVIEENILGMAQSSWNIYVKWFSFYYKYQNNNHKGKMAAALGLVGMTLNNSSKAAEYVNYAVPELDFILTHQSTEEGGFSEGTYYQTYGTETYLPFFMAYHDYAKGKALPYQQTCETQSRVFNCEKGTETISDFYTNPRVKVIYDWWIAVMMPDGMGPDFDDSNRWGFHGAVLGGMFNEPMYRAAWERNTEMPYYTRGCQDLNVESLILFPDTLAPAWPSWTSRFLPDAGTATFRSDWTSTARYLLLLAEHDNQIHGGHEQPDGTSILLHAYGEYLIRDSGYGSWSQRQEVSSAENHSLVLIDGKGPHDSASMASNGADTYLENCYALPGLERCDARTSFSDVTQVRTVYFLENESFVVIDRLTPDNRSTHSYASLWQSNAGGGTDGTFVQTSTGMQVVRPKAQLGLSVASTQGMPVLSHHLMSHAAGYGVLSEHEVLQAEVSGESVTLMAVMDVAPTGAAAPTLTTLSASGGVAAVKSVEGSRSTLSIVTEPGVTAKISTGISGLPEVVTDADFAWIEFQNGVAVEVHQEGATVLTVGGVSKF